MENVLQHTRKSDIAFRKGGVIYIKARLTKLLDLHEHDVIGILYDKELRSYMLYRRIKDAYGNHDGRCVTLRHGKRRSHYLRVNSVALCAPILKEFAADSVDLPVGEPIQVEPYGLCVPLLRLNLQ